MDRQSLAGVLPCMGVLLVLATACPHEWAKGGTVDRAIRKDRKQSMTPPEAEWECPEGMHPERECSDPECEWICQ